MEKFKHFISLGYFCSTALELEKIGYRDCSSPFDWIISDFVGVEKAIESRFSNFLIKENLYQNINDKASYKDCFYNFEFFHDFSQYKSLDEQLHIVKEKYKRRIEKFYENISNPTLFIRYICSDNGNNELKYIDANYYKILELLKSFNESNEIIFISNKNDFICKNIKKIYYVQTDFEDSVSRKPFENNIELMNYLLSLECENRLENLKIYYRKNKKQSNIFLKIINKVKINLDKICLKEYININQYDKEKFYKSGVNNENITL